MRFEVTFEGVILGADSLSEEKLEEHFDTVTEALIAFDVDSPAVSGSLAEGTIEIEVALDAPTPEAALADARSLVRRAIEAAGGEWIEDDHAMVSPHWAMDWRSATTRREELIRA